MTSSADPLGNKPALAPATVANPEWGTDPEAALSAVENQAWEHDPDQDDARAASPQEETQEVQPETPQPEAEAQAAPEPQDEIPADASQRAQERIRETIAERNAERERANQLQAMLEKLVQTQTRATALQEQQFAEHAARQRAEKTKQTEEQLLTKFRAYGLNETETKDWLAFEAIQKAEVAERKLAEFQAQETKRQQEARIMAYENSLRREVESAAKRFKIAEEDVPDLFEQAYAVARAKQIADPSVAAAQVLKPYARMAKPAAVATKRPDPADPVHNAISARGRQAERGPDGKFTGRTKVRDVEEIEREMGAGRFD